MQVKKNVISGSFPVYAILKLLREVLGSIFEIQECFAAQKSIFDLFGEKSPARRVTV